MGDTGWRNVDGLLQFMDCFVSEGQEFSTIHELLVRRINDNIYILAKGLIRSNASGAVGNGIIPNDWRLAKADQYMGWN